RHTRRARDPAGAESRRRERGRPARRALHERRAAAQRERSVRTPAAGATPAARAPAARREPRPERPGCAAAPYARARSPSGEPVLMRRALFLASPFCAAIAVLPGPCTTFDGVSAPPADAGPDAPPEDHNVADAPPPPLCEGGARFLFEPDAAG